MMWSKKTLSIVLAIASVGTAIAAVTANHLTATPNPTNVTAQTTSPAATPCSTTRGFSRNNHRSMMASMQVQSEFDYLAKMIPHHQEAIETAKVLLAGTQRSEMKQFAQAIIRVQSAEIQQMQAWLKQRYPDRSAQVGYVPMMRELTTLKGNDLDRAFLEDMPMHHMGAVMMSHQLLNRNLATHDDVKTLANAIATSQRQEIGQMQAWLRDWFGVSGGMMGGGMMGGDMMGGSMKGSNSVCPATGVKR